MLGYVLNYSAEWRGGGEKKGVLYRIGCVNTDILCLVS